MAYTWKDDDDDDDDETFGHKLGLFGWGIGSSQGLYLHRTTESRETWTNIHA
jgi:hypothetical protein